MELFFLFLVMELQRVFGFLVQRARKLSAENVSD